MSSQTVEECFEDMQFAHCPACNSPGLTNVDDIMLGECLECGFLFCTNCENEFHGSSECDLVMGIAELEIEATHFDCPICMEKIANEEAADLGCEHLHCKECVKTFYESLINEAKVHNFKCPSTKNCDILIAPNTIKSLVHPDIFAKYDSFLLDEALQDFPEIVNCPKPDCGKLLASKPEYGHCESCDYRFCTNCMRAYHGLSDCNQTEEERLEMIKNLLEADEAEREKLEREEQERKIKIEKDNIELISKTSKKCPQCRADIEKNGGCQHMTCIKCNTHFCWLCLKVVDVNNLGAHFKEDANGCSLFNVPPE